MWRAKSREDATPTRDVIAASAPLARMLRNAAIEAVEATRFEVWRSGKEAKMLWTIFVVLLVLWLLGMVTSYTMGGFIHLLLVLALAALLIRIIQGRRPV